MKKFLTLIFGTLVFVSATITTQAFYSDVPEDHTYYPAIASLYNLGLLPDTPAFRPDEKLTKAELYALIISYSKLPLATDIQLPYTDTDNSAEYAAYLQTAINNKLLNTFGKIAEFHPDTTVAKNFALEKLFQIFGIGTPLIFDKEGLPFSDISADSWVGALANQAVELGIYEIANPAKFRLAKRITRAEAAHYLFKILNYKPQNQTITIEILTGDNDYSDSENSLLNHESFGTLLDVWSSLQDNYLLQEELDEQKMIFGAIKGLVGELSDKYTVFQSPDETGSLVSKLSSEYEGIGIVIELIDEKVTVVSPFKDSPAEKAGIKAYDVIFEVEGENIEGKSLDYVSNKIRGPSGTDVKIKIRRSMEIKEFTVTREFILIKTVESELLPENIGYLNILNFAQGTYEEFIAAATELKKKNPKGFIVDLRNNPGGYLDVSVNVTGAFIKETKTAVTLQYADQSKEEYKTNGNGLLADYKIVVLINEGSASASEIVAGALQDFSRAMLIGTKSFGKGSAQELKQYNDGSLFKYTISNWLTPNGKNINGAGITPNKTVKSENGNTVDEQLQAAIKEF